MTRVPDNRLIDLRENPEPDEKYNPVPWLLWAVVLSLAVWGVSYFYMQSYPTGAPSAATTGASPQPGAGPVAAAQGPDGAQIFNTRCVACHQAGGTGLPGVFPPLAGSEWVNAKKPETVADILLLGIQGGIQVKGGSYNGTMPTFGTMLSDAEIAAVGTYVRSHFGNSGSAIDESVVKAERAKLAGHAPWKGGDELKADL